MIYHRLRTRPWTIQRVVPTLFFLTVFLFPFLCRAYEETAPPKSNHGDVETPNNPLIDRLIPSKPQDLFVVLKNGLTVLIRKTHGSDVVFAQALVRTGSIYEGTRIQGGLSHYLEHVVSGGTTSELTEAEIQERLQAIGGVSNAYTSYEHTVYFIKTTRPHYREALSLLLTYVTDCRFDETEYQREKGVILQELQMGENDPSRQLWQLFMKTAYREHPVRYPVIGERDVFVQMGKEDLVAHYRRWYTPENMIVTLAGDIEQEEALKTVIDLAGSLKRAPSPPYVLPAEPPQLAERRVEKSLPTARLTQVQLGFRSVALADPDLYPLDVLAVVMGDGRTSRLYRTIRDEKGLVLSISAGNWTPAFIEGQFFVSMDLAQENLSKALDAVLEQLSTVADHPVSRKALQRAKKKVVADHVFDQETVQSQAGQLASDWAATGDPYFSEDYVSKVQAVTAEDVMRVAKKYFQRDRMTVAIVRPSEAGSEATRSEAETSASRVQIQKIVMPNDMTLLLKKMAAVPMVTLNFVVGGGLRFEPADKTGLSQFMAALLTKGTENRSKIEIAQAIEDVGGTLRSSSGYNTVSVSVTVLKEDFDVALEVLSDVVLHPTFPAEEIEKQRKETQLAIQRLDEQWTTEVTRLFKRHYYRKHPYRNDVLGSAEAVNRFSREDVKRFYESVVLPNNAVLAVFGDIDIEDAASRVKKAFAGFRPGIPVLPIIEKETSNIVHDEAFEVFNEKTSAALMVGYNGLTLNDPDRPALDVLDAVISGIDYPSGWLFNALRGGNKSLVYVVYAYPAFGVDAGYFGVLAQTTPENYEEVLKTILDQMTLIQKTEVDAKTLEHAKVLCVSSHEMSLEGIAAQALSAAVNEILGLGCDYDERYPGLVDQVTGEDVLRVAKKLFPHHLIVATKPGPDKEK
jgi:zinc protease